MPFLRRPMALVTKPSPAERVVRALILIGLTTGLFLFGLAVTVVAVTE